MIRHETQARLLDDVRAEAETEQSILWAVEGGEMYLEVAHHEDGLDRYVWSPTDGRYVHPVGNSGGGLRSA